jgi:hypothetical protein
MRDGSNDMSGTFAVRRKAIKRALPWSLTARDIYPVTPPQDEDIRETKRPRLETPIAAATPEVATNNTSHDTAAAAIAAAVPGQTLHSSIERARGRTGTWIKDEDIKLKDAVQMHGGKDWAAIAAMVPGRTKIQCSNRWHIVLDPSMTLTAGSTGTWTEDEDSKLKDAVQTHGGKNWNKIAAMVPGRTKSQCGMRWHDALHPSIDRANGRTGKWTEDEDLKLKAAVQMHGGKDWVAIAALVPGRTKKQCNRRWHSELDPSIALTAGSTGTWTEGEDLKLKNSVQTHGGKDWNAIAAMVPGRTKNQCNKRWHDALTPSIALVAGRPGTWTEEEDLKLKNSVQMHGGKDWAAIAAMVPGRTKNQCNKRWHDALDPSMTLTAGSTGTWTEDEDLKLKNSVQTHGGKDWNAIAAMVPGRTKNQCNKRWRDALDPSIALTAGSTGTWTEDEDLMLKAAVQTHGGKNWNAIAAMIPGRTKSQCRDRWMKRMDPNRSTVQRKEHGSLNKAPGLGQGRHSP